MKFLEVNLNFSFLFKYLRCQNVNFNLQLFFCFLALSFFSTPVLSKNTTHLEYDQVKWRDYSKPWMALSSEIDRLQGKTIFDDPRTEFVTKRYKESEYKISTLRKSKTALVFIHGLYGGASQFSKLVETFGDRYSESSIISLTLPGHYYNGNYDQPLKVANYSEWILAVKDTLKIANMISDKVIVIGQSTGGLLAVYSGLYLKEFVDGIILLEPALKVSPKIRIATCIGKYFVDEASDVRWLAKLLVQNAPDGISVEMGCEVSKLASFLFKDRKKYIGPRSKGFFKVESVDHVNSRVVPKVDVPTLMFNNLADKIVSPSVNLSFFKNLTREGTYIGLTEKMVGQHGDLKTIGSSFRSNHFYRFTCIFLATNFGESSCIHEYVKYHLRKFTDWINPEEDDIRKYQERVAEITSPTYIKILIRDLCLIARNSVKNKNICTKIEKFLKIIVQQGILPFHSYVKDYSDDTKYEEFQKIFYKYREEYLWNQDNFTDILEAKNFLQEGLLNGVAPVRPIRRLSYYHHFLNAKVESENNMVISDQTQKVIELAANVISSQNGSINSLEENKLLRDLYLSKYKNRTYYDYYRCILFFKTLFKFGFMNPVEYQGHVRNEIRQLISIIKNSEEFNVSHYRQLSDLENEYEWGVVASFLKWEANRKKVEDFSHFVIHNLK